MNNRILYLDCDGVILDTMDEAFTMMREVGLDANNRNDVHNFFINVNWNILVSRAEIINNAINKITQIVESNIYKDVIILTKLSGNLEEEQIKRKLFNTLLPNITVITLPFASNKDETVDPRGNILIDDSTSNIKRWRNADGIGILFNKKTNNYRHNIISDLEDIGKTTLIKRLIKIKE